jgi:hypothetical protein
MRFCLYSSLIRLQPHEFRLCSQAYLLSSVEMPRGPFIFAAMYWGVFEHTTVVSCALGVLNFSSDGISQSSHLGGLVSFPATLCLSHRAGIM